MCDCCETGSHKGPYSSDPGAAHMELLPDPIPER